MKLATLCYIRKNGKTLMLHRNKKEGDVHAGKWNGLGGKFAPGETPEACAVREVMEESGLFARKLEMKGFLTFPSFAKGEDWYVFVFLITDFDGTIQPSPEGTLEWIDDDALLDLPLWEGDRLFLPWLVQPRFFSARFDYQRGKLIGHHVVFHPSDPE